MEEEIIKHIQQQTDKLTGYLRDYSSPQKAVVTYLICESLKEKFPKCKIDANFKIILEEQSRYIDIKLITPNLSHDFFILTAALDFSNQGSGRIRNSLKANQLSKLENTTALIVNVMKNKIKISVFKQGTSRVI